MKASIKHLLFFFYFWGLSCFPGSLFVWQPTPSHPKMIMFASDAKNVRAQINLYLEKAKTSPQTIGLEGTDSLKNYEGTIIPFEALLHNHSKLSPKFLVLANELADFEGGEDNRIFLFSEHLKKAGGEPYFLPPVSDIALSEKEAAEFRSLLTKNFDAVLAIGGSDIHPSLYGQEIIYARPNNLARDLSEQAVLQNYARNGRGPIFGVCRGHQLCSILMGASLIQDIPKQTASTINHQDGYHEIVLSKDSFLYKILGKEKILVNSYHHEAINLSSILRNNSLQVTALSVENNPIVEGTDWSNGKGFTFQWHPELIEDQALASAVFKGMVDRANLLRSPAFFCSNLFATLLKH